jgi:DsbC/DsbD-like thiol-disulfide interchange protein
MPIIIFVIMLLMVMTGGSPAIPDHQSPPKVVMRCVAGQDVAVPGSKIDVICTLEIPNEFHVYWWNPGASGTPTEVTVSAPEGSFVKPTRYPRPAVFRGPEGDTYGYEDRVDFIVPVQLPSTLEGEMVSLQIRANWLACRKLCFMGRDSVTIDVPIRREGSAHETVVLQKAMRFMPKPISERLRTHVQLLQDRLLVVGPLDGDGPPSFLPGAVPGVVLETPMIRLSEKKFELIVPFQLHPEDALGVRPSIQGLLMFGPDRSGPSFEIRMPVAETSPPEHPGGGED